MEIKIARVSGVCFGVERVLALADKALEKGELETLGPIIHNPQVVNHLKAKGVEVISRIEESKRKTVLIRAHGVAPEIFQQARAEGIRILDGTCPYVKDVQKAAKTFYERGWDVIIVGMKEHPEVIGVQGYVDRKAVVVSCPEDVDALPRKPGPVGVVVQSTFRQDIFGKCVVRLIAHYDEGCARNTRCQDTDERQNAVVELSREVEVLLVVGGKDSSNTKKLWELASLNGCRSYHIEQASEIQPEWFAGVQKVGIIGGASTPQWLIDEVIEKLRSFDAPSL
ncbi:MAG: 4-hydroxy-3-methylbut-2-enyl diphosphate reductase [bacterium JZ-2024 1]